MSWTRRPIRLAADNFTPATRTPWGGRRIVERYKRDLDLDPARREQAVIGESWEVSLDPDFPSDAIDPAGERVRLDALLKQAPRDLLGRDAAQAATPMLIKLLDAADDLSVQVHPDDAYEGLAPDESGKPECWYILEATPGAGLYLGLAPGVGREALARALEEGRDLRALLHFVPVEAGDFFVIAPGTVHAIGAGVTLVEPQLVRPGKRGKTYRLWDWGRRYDGEGRRDPGGEPRPLHAAASLAVTAFDGPRGEAFVDGLRPERRVLHEVGGATHEHLGQLEQMSVERLRGTGRIALRSPGTLRVLLVTRGSLAIRDPEGGESEARQGTTWLLPAALSMATLVVEDAEALLIYMRPPVHG